jgi:DUF4097 and DUF4098 domain-containing protein YvlB/uncharacterized membrane protein HdeD (DUF308 family)
MLKRIATFLLGIALVSLGVLFFVAPERAFLLQILVRYWPIFLILAGVVRVGGYLLDRQPRSPMGGMLLTATGAVLLSSNLRGETRVLEIIATHWFFFLLAIVAARVIRQYTHRSELGPRPNAFTIPAVAVMVLVSGIGLGAHWMSTHSEQLSSLRLPFRFGDFRTIFDREFSVADELRPLDIASNGKLIVDALNGDLDVHTIAAGAPSVRLVKKIRAANEQDARSIAQRISLDIRQNGNDRILSLNDGGATSSFRATLTVELPRTLTTSVMASAISGVVTLTGLRGTHSFKDINALVASDNDGDISVDGAGKIKLDRIRGRAVLSRATRQVELSEILRGIALNLDGGAATLEKTGGSIDVSGRNARIELRDLTSDLEPVSSQIQLKDLSDSRIIMTRVNGNITVDAQRTRVDASEISGTLSVRSSSEKVKIAGVRGTLRAVVSEGSLEAENIEGPAELEAGREIIARNFQNTLSAITRLGTITLSLDGQVAGDVRAESEHGSVSFSLPETSNFRLDAATTFGRLKLRGFTYLNVLRKQRLSSVTYGRDPEAPLLTLRTTNGDISITPAASSIASRDGRAAN